MWGTFVSHTLDACGTLIQYIQHCQKLAPEYSKAALGLYPLIATYAVDCDKEKNKRLCAEQGVQGFPTLKVRTLSIRLLGITHVGDSLAVPSRRSGPPVGLYPHGTLRQCDLLLGF